MLGVTYLDNASDSEAFVRAHGVTYPVIRDVNGSFVRSFGTTGVPESFVIDRRGPDRRAAPLPARSALGRPDPAARILGPRL